MFKKHPLIFRFLVMVILPAFVGLLYLFFYLKSSLMPTSGTLAIAGLDHGVEITHDIYGTPRIVAITDHDAYFALGFKHASDRLWQLEVQRRLSQGRLSELFGAQMLPEDITMRTFGLYEAARNSLPYLKKTTVDALTAYADGINAWIAQSPSLPFEFQLFGIRPEPWSIVDSLGWQKAFSLTLSGNMTDELRRVQLQKQFTPEQIRYIYPYDPVGLLENENTSPVSYLIPGNSQLFDFGIGHLFTGSNAWVVSGKYTQSGHPILANDPHIGLQLPSSWYAASLKGDKLNVSGMTLVGLPMVIFGQNSAIAWGGTNLQSDQQDLFFETTSPQKPNQYLDGDKWEIFESRKEKIEVGAAFPAFLREKLNPVEIIVRSTKRGPVVSDIQPEANGTISLRWSALDPEDHTIDAFFEIQYAGNWREFRQSLSNLKSPGLNFLYADREGNIGHQVAGMMPRRAEGVGILPLVVSGKNDWQGYHNFESLPSVYNPEKGFIVSANEKIEHSPDIVISHEWAPKARHDRITTLIQQSIAVDEGMTVSDMEAIQADNVDLTALALLPALRTVVGKTPQEKAALAVLEDWNGKFHSESVGATLFATWSHYLTHQVFDPVLRHSWQRPGESDLLLSSLGRLNWSGLANVVTTNAHGWCEANQGTVCAKELQSSLESTLEQLSRVSGTESVSEWTWSEFSSTEYVHQPLGRVKGIEWLFKRNTDSVTSPNSINAANLQFDPLKGFTKNFGSSFRQVIELKKDHIHWYMVSTGQSGNFMSMHFDDMIKPFSRAKLTRLDVKDQSEDVLKLVPSTGKQR